MNGVIAGISGAVLGPLFDKELRVTSRRRRYYVMRFLYLAALTAFVVSLWLRYTNFMSYEYQLAAGSSLVASQMSEAGKEIIGQICWFQFIVMQLLAAVLMSGSINSEVRQRTISVLCATPISAWKILLGKLASGLLPLFVLLCVSFPLLAIVRVFGGVPWDFVLASMAITFSATILVGAISQRMSITCKDPIWAIFWTLYGYILLTLAPLICALPLLFFGASGVALGMTSPVLIMHGNYENMMVAGGTPGLPLNYIWPIHCTLMLLMALGVMSRSRQLFLRLEATLAGKITSKRAKQMSDARHDRSHGEPEFVSLDVAIATAADSPDESAPPAPVQSPASVRNQTIRPVSGNPLVWKELRFFTPGSLRHTTLGVLAVVAILSLLYYMGAASGVLRDYHYIYLLLYLTAGVLVTMFLAPACITSEKQSQAMAVLLTTPVTDWNIILCKALGVFRRAMPMWALLVAHVLLFTPAGLMRWPEGLNMILLALWTSVFLIGLGLYFSSRFKTTMGAMTAQLLVVLILWVFLPFIIPRSLGAIGRQVTIWSQIFNPILQGWTFLRGMLPDVNRIRYGIEEPQMVKASVQNLACLAIYSAAGALLTWRAKARLRKDLF